MSIEARPLELPRQYQWWGLLPAVAGLYALSLIEGVVSAALVGVSALLWTVTGLSLVLLPGDPRVTAYMALASVLGVLVALPMVFAAGFAPALLLGLFGVACFVVEQAGRVGEEAHGRSYCDARSRG